MSLDKRIGLPRHGERSKQDVYGPGEDHNVPHGFRIDFKVGQSAFGYQLNSETTLRSMVDRQTARFLVYGTLGTLALVSKEN